MDFQTTTLFNTGLVTRDYGAACRVLDEWCRSDKALAPEERFWLSLFYAEAVLPERSLLTTIPADFAAVLLRAARPSSPKQSPHPDISCVC